MIRAAYVYSDFYDLPMFTSVYVESLVEGSKANVIFNHFRDNESRRSGEVVDVVDSANMYTEDYDSEVRYFMKSYDIVAEYEVDEDYYTCVGIDLDD